MPVRASREAFAKASLASARTGARSAATRIPYGLVLSRGLVMTWIVGAQRTGSVPEPDKLHLEFLIDRPFDAGCLLFRSIED
jgi:hypothetical protein